MIAFLTSYRDAGQIVKYNERICRVCPSLTASLMNMDTPIVHALFMLCDPSIQLILADHHPVAFRNEYAIVKLLVL